MRKSSFEKNGLEYEVIMLRLLCSSMSAVARYGLAGLKERNYADFADTAASKTGNYNFNA